MSDSPNSLSASTSRDGAANDTASSSGGQSAAPDFPPAEYCSTLRSDAMSLASSDFEDRERFWHNFFLLSQYYDQQKDQVLDEQAA